MTDKTASPELVEQVRQQYRAVASLAGSIATVHEQIGGLIGTGCYADEKMLQMVGGWSASIMEDLGNILNEMDACDDADEWMTPIFERAHEMFPRDPRP